jgi:hypothetical protein
LGDGDRSSGLMKQKMGLKYKNNKYIENLIIQALLMKININAAISTSVRS